MKVTYYGHSCFAVETGGKTLLFDPFITGNPLAKHVDVKSIPADYVLISHAHADHISDVAAIVRRTDALVIANYEITVWLGRVGVHKTHAMNLGGAWKFDFGRVKYVTAVHSSSFPDGCYGGNPGGFVVETGEGNFYYSGDTALTLEMKLIADSTALNFVVLSIGDNFTMGVDDAIQAANFLKCGRILGVHYDTFSPIKIDHDAAREKFKTAGKTLYLPAIGASLEL